jgi:hypothetical protein
MNECATNVTNKQESSPPPPHSVIAEMWNIYTFKC